MLSKIPDSNAHSGSKIVMENGRLIVPDDPAIPYIEGDGSGPDIWRASRRVLDAAIELTYPGQRKIHWFEVFAGEKSFNQFGTWLPDETLQAFTRIPRWNKGPADHPGWRGDFVR